MDQKESSIQAPHEPSLRSIPSVQTSGYFNHGLRESSECKWSGHLEQEPFWKNCFDFSHSLRDRVSPITLSDPHKYPAMLSVKNLTKPKHSLSVYWNLTFSSLTFCRDGRNLPDTYYLRIITASPLTVACQGLKKKITNLSTALIFSCKTTKVASDLFAHFSQAWLQSPASS